MNIHMDTRTVQVRRKRTRNELDLGKNDARAGRSWTMSPRDRPRVTLSRSANRLRKEEDRDSIRRIAPVSDVMMGW